MRALGSLPVFIVCLAIPSATIDEMKKEMEAFQGEWRLTGVEADGKQNDVPDEERVKVVFKDDRLFIGGEEKFTFKIDPVCDPRIIDLIPHEEKDKEEVLDGIYRFSGTKLTLCLRGASRIRMRPLKLGEENSMTFTLEKRSK